MDDVTAVVSEAAPRAGRKKASRKGARRPAETLKVARVAVDMSLPHLDRPFDYLVPSDLDEKAVPGCRVRVRFAGQLVDGFLLERVEESDHDGRLSFVDRVISPEPVLTPEIAALAREVADRYAGTLADVLRLAVPPRHARVEAERRPAVAEATVRIPGGARKAAATEADDAGQGTAPAGEEAGGAEGGTAEAEVSSAGRSADPEREVAGPETGGAERGTEPARGAADDQAGAMDGGAGGDAGALGVGADAGGGSGGTGQGADAEGDASGTEGDRTGRESAATLSERVDQVAGGAGRAVPEGEGRLAGGGAGLVAPGTAGGAVPEGESGTAGDGADAVGRSGGSGRGADAVGDAVEAEAGGGEPRAEEGQQARGVGSRADVGREAEDPGPRAERETPGTESGSAGRAASEAESDPVERASSGSESDAAVQAASERRSGTASGGAGQRTAAPLDPGPWEAYRAGPSFLAALTAGRAPHAVWTALPGTDWTAFVARAARATLDGGQGVLIVVADGREVARVDAALRAEEGVEGHVALTAELGPAERYRRWLTVLRGEVKVVVGTRAAMFAPVRDLGLVVLWDDGDDVHAEPHAPYPHAREVLALRAHRAGAGALIGGFTRTTDATQLVETGWAHALVPDRDRLRRSMPYVRPAGDDAELARDEAARTARLPHLAFRAARQGLETGPVLVQVPRRGYVPALACARCRGPARCPECEGPLALTSGHAAPYCRWCGRIAGMWRCPECSSPHVRAVVVGARRTAEELGRAFPGVPVRTSGRDGVLDSVGPEPALVVATPGAEPVPADGYAAALLLDGWVLLGRADLRAGEEAMRRWTDAAALVRSGGPVIVLADGALTPVQALIRWDPVTFAERELAERRELGFPPAVRMASLTGSPQAIRELVEAAGLPPDAEVLGPVEVGDGQERALVRVDRARGVALARCLKAAQAARSARKAADVVRVQVDPLELI
ncbi:primosomal protein N' [Actinoallomurus sp. CA-150999]|uniref:primosomal protein N' n=1 Tax=Actinoallomurus sp. CA-150999 TaxID=3239887 RepID=UPI003D91F211